VFGTAYANEAKAKVNTTLITNLGMESDERKYNGV